MKMVFASLLLVALVLCIRPQWLVQVSVIQTARGGAQKFCGICCEACNCVPSGTCGNKDECPCYRDMKNSKGTSKCP